MKSMQKNAELHGQNTFRSNTKGDSMQEKNELNDIILNKGNASSGNKKVILAVATLGVILIIVIMLMNTLTSNEQNNLPKPVPLPKPQSIQSDLKDDAVNEPLFEEVEVETDNNPDAQDLDAIAQKLKKESLQKPISKPVSTPVSKTVAKKKEVKKKPTPKKMTGNAYYVQVGSFLRYKPNKKFLDSIEDRGYQYKFAKIDSLTKVLVGPFANEKEARGALRNIRSNIEAGAFLTKH